MQSNNVVFIIGLLFVIGWFGTTAYGHYTKMKSDIARIESNAEDYRTSIKVLGDAAAASAAASKDGLARAIERLAERQQ